VGQDGEVREGVVEPALTVAHSTFNAPDARQVDAGDVVRSPGVPLGWLADMGSLIKKRRKRMRKKKHKKMLKRTRWQRRAGK
jgi:hypothetical protein